MRRMLLRHHLVSESLNEGLQAVEAVPSPLQGVHIVRNVVVNVIHQVGTGVHCRQQRQHSNQYAKPHVMVSDRYDRQPRYDWQKL